MLQFLGFGTASRSQHFTNIKDCAPHGFIFAFANFIKYIDCDLVWSA
jgi:hypothetical protein